MHYANRAHRLAATVFRDVEWPPFYLKRSTRRDAHGGQDGGVQVADRDGMARHQQRPLLRGLTVQEAALHPAAEHEDRARARKVAV